MISEADLRFIEQYSPNGTGWARFSPDMTKRYRLARALHPAWAWPTGIGGPGNDIWREGSLCQRVVFLLLNPSTATAFKPDNTFTKCCQFAQVWGADVFEIVNLFSFRTQYPSELIKATDRGADATNDEQILIACRGASKVIAGWGNDGELDGRDGYVRNMLAAEGIQLYHFGKTNSGMPLHPLARGKSFIPLTREPQVYA